MAGRARLKMKLTTEKFKKKIIPQCPVPFREAPIHLSGPCFVLPEPDLFCGALTPDRQSTLDWVPSGSVGAVGPRQWPWREGKRCVGPMFYLWGRYNSHIPCDHHCIIAPWVWPPLTLRQPSRPYTRSLHFKYYGDAPAPHGTTPWNVMVRNH